MGRNKPNNIKAQGAVEFVLITAVLMIIFSTGIIVAESNLLKIQEQRTEQLIDEYIDGIETELQLGIEAGPGYTRKFYIPETIQGINYDITYVEGPAGGRDELIISTPQGNYVRFMNQPTDGDLGKGWNEVQGGNPVTVIPNVDPPIPPTPPDPGEPTDTTPPNNPSGLTLVLKTHNTAKLTWTASTDAESGISHYNIYNNNVYFTTIGSPPATVTGLTPETNYKFKLSATNGEGLESGKSNQLQFTTEPDPIDTTPPTKPLNLRVDTSNPITHDTITVTWTASTDAESGIDTYTVYVDGTPYTTALTTYTITGLTPETTYTISVKATNGVGLDSPMSDPIDATTIAEPLAEDWSSLMFAFNKRIKIDLNTGLIDLPLSNFPLHITLSQSTIPGFLYSDITPFTVPGGLNYDIRFTDSTGTQQYSYEVDEWNPDPGDPESEGVSHLYVKVSYIESTGEQYIYMYYNELIPSSHTFNNPGKVWEDYGAVWHLSDTPGGTGSIKDSATILGNDHATPYNLGSSAITTSDYLGRGLSLDGVDDYLISWLSSGTNIQGSSIMLSAWIKTPSGGIPFNEEESVLTKPNNNFCNQACPKPPELSCNTGPCDNLNYPYMIGVEYNDGTFLLDDPTKYHTNCRISTTAGQPQSVTRHNVPFVSKGVWTYLACTYDGSEFKSLVDGTVVHTTAVAGTILPGKEYLIIGARKNAGDSNSERYYGGFMDEIRITAHPDAKEDHWIKAQYYTQKGDLQSYSVESKP